MGIDPTDPAYIAVVQVCSGTKPSEELYKDTDGMLKYEHWREVGSHFVWVSVDTDRQEGLTLNSCL